MSYEGSCHCGAVQFTVEGEAPTDAFECNCSHCRRKGFLLTFVPADQFELAAGEDNLVDYRFNKKLIAHKLCKTCGTEAFAEGVNSDGGDIRMVNLRCVPEIDFADLKISMVDGARY